MKNPTPKNVLNPNWNTATNAPHGKEHLNEDRLKALEEAKQEHLPATIQRLEKRLASLQKQMQKVQSQLTQAKNALDKEK